MPIEKYLNKKSWHPTSLSNQRRLYVAQERNAEEERQKKRLRVELEKERAFERDMEAQRAAATSSASPESIWCRAGESERGDKSSGRSKRRKKQEDAHAEMERNKRVMRFMYEAPPEVRNNQDGAAEAEDDTDVHGNEEAGAQRGELPVQKTRDIYGRAVATQSEHEELRNAPREAGLSKNTIMRHSALGQAFYANGSKWSASDGTWYSSASLPSEKLALQEREERNQRLRLESTPMGMLEAREALASSSRLQLKDGAADWHIAAKSGDGTTTSSSMLLPPPSPDGGDDHVGTHDDDDDERRRRRRQNRKEKKRARKEFKKKKRMREKEERANNDNAALHVS